MSKPQRFYDGLFWRFRVQDVSVERFLVRDCDSVFTVKERVAVDAWLHSNHYFHVMRDWHTHCDLVLAGMWGGVGNVLPSVGELLAQYAIKGLPVRTIDQRFLREQLWPTIKQSCLVMTAFLLCPVACLSPCLDICPKGDTSVRSILISNWTTASWSLTQTSQTNRLKSSSDKYEAPTTSIVCV